MHVRLLTMLMPLICSAPALFTEAHAMENSPQEDPDIPAAATEAQMTDEERMNLLQGIMPIPIPTPRQVKVPTDAKPSSGYVFGVPRLGIPPLRESDASLGIANMFGLRKNDVATALPSALALASSFSPDLAYASGAMIAGEARSKDFNVLLAGGINLARDPRNGRNFEYLGEDPLLAGTLGGESIKGIQSQGVISTVKHFSLNDQETMRSLVDARIEESAHRESDLLAFEIAIERGHPGSVMCAYNKVNGTYSCGSDALINGVLKGDWGFKGWVMSDWGATHDVSYFKAGLDQQSGSQIDADDYFGTLLKAEIDAGRVPKTRVSDAVKRILRSIYAVGADWKREEREIDYAANAKVARKVAEQGIVLLKNDGILPLVADAKTILVVGGYADIGVMSGGGSSQVLPVGGPAAKLPVGGTGIMSYIGQQVIIPSSPLKALTKSLPNATIVFDSGYDAGLAAARARHADIVLVFATKWQVEGQDSASLALPLGQDSLIEGIAKANPNTVVILETGNPVTMPWLPHVRGVLQAWYPGQEGGAAISDILTGAVNPSGRLPLTFPVSDQQNPRPEIPGFGVPANMAQLDGPGATVNYTEGSNVGYRWFASEGEKPLFAFGYGLSYTSFEHSKPVVKFADGSGSASFTIRNGGARDGADVAQLYLISANGKPVRRLVGYARVELKAGETKSVEIAIEPRTVAQWKDGNWEIAKGRYKFALGASAEALEPATEIDLPARRW